MMLITVITTIFYAIPLILLFLLLFISFIYSIYLVFNELKREDKKTASWTRHFLPQKQRYKLELQDYRWKAKRKKILKRDNYKCVNCGCKQNLQVHHKYYERYPNNYPADAWDYPDAALITLCDKCHKAEHKMHKIKSYYRSCDTHYTN